MEALTRTDLAVEFGLKSKTAPHTGAVKTSSVTVDEAYSEKTGRAAGVYFTVETDSVKLGDRTVFSAVAKELSKAVKKLGKAKSCLVAGLGNPDLTADSLGKRVLDRIMITRHLIPDGKKLPRLSGLCPNVLGVTGIESFDIIKGVVEKTRPQSVIVVDSLAAAAVERIASAFQVSNAGITPGSGVSNHRKRLDSGSLGVDVISIGVPLVVYASTIIGDAAGKPSCDLDPSIASLIVTPKDIDLLVSDCADIIARAINLAFFNDEFTY
jgi:spore protease